jgi:hypothetical protein
MDAYTRCTLVSKIETHQAYGVYFWNEDVRWKQKLHNDAEGSTDTLLVTDQI